MSRIGKIPVPVPEGVDVAVEGNTVTAQGPRGVMHLDLPSKISARVDNGVIRVDRPDDTVESKSLHGLSRSLVNNMLIGVTDGFLKELQIQGVGYRARLSGSAVS